MFMFVFFPMFSRVCRRIPKHDNLAAYIHKATTNQIPNVMIMDDVFVTICDIHDGDMLLVQQNIQGMQQINDLPPNVK
jgi:hypothetical protein